jgi:hypothetical protein
MTRRIIIIIIAALLLLLFSVIIKSAIEPRPFSWYPSYSSALRQPYDTRVFFTQLRRFFPGQKVKRLGTDDFQDYYPYINEVSAYPDLIFDSDAFPVDEVPENYERAQEDDSLLLLLDTMALAEPQNNDSISINFGVEDGVPPEYLEDFDSSLTLLDLEFDTSYFVPFNVVVVNDYFDCNELDMRALLLHTYQGNDVFVAASELNYYLKVFLGLKTEYDTARAHQEYSDEFVVQVHDELPVQLKNYSEYAYFTAYPDSASVIATNKRGQVLGVKVKVGKGSFTCFSMPIIFTNYYILKDDHSVAENLLVDLPNRNTYWGSFIRGRRQYEEQESLLSFVHSQESLTWAFYTIIIGLLILFAFQIKREQRIIPIMRKPQNDSLRFVEVISNLYLLNKDNKALLKKKMTYFLEMVRSHYHMNTAVVDEAFYLQLSNKARVEKDIIKKIFRDYKILSRQEKIPNPELLHFNKLIQHFKRRQ